MGFIRVLRALQGAAGVFAEEAGGHAGEGAEHLGKIVVVADAHLLRHGGDGQTALQQQPLGGLDAALGDEPGQGAPAGQLLGQGAQLGAADVDSFSI